jgi:hypothetical protein
MRLFVCSLSALFDAIQLFGVPDFIGNYPISDNEKEALVHARPLVELGCCFAAFWKL